MEQVAAYPNEYTTKSHTQRYWFSVPQKKIKQYLYFPINIRPENKNVGILGFHKKKRYLKCYVLFRKAKQKCSTKSQKTKQFEGEKLYINTCFSSPRSSDLVDSPGTTGTGPFI